MKPMPFQKGHQAWRLRKPKHGMWKTPEWRTWAGLRNRCQNSNNKDYKNYGGRGIKVCDRWARFENFYADMGSRPEPHNKIERRDNDGPYSPENCYWGTPTDQTRNRRISRVITHNGETLPLIVWAKRTGIKYTTLFTRFNLGYPVEKLFAPKKLHYNRWSGDSV